jgi:hypothetical protein
VERRLGNADDGLEDLLVALHNRGGAEGLIDPASAGIR